MSENLKCAKCAGAMTEGFLFDRGHYDTKMQQVWVAGIAEESIWARVQTSGREAFYVQAFHCANCGFIEFYSTDKADLSGIFN